MRKNSFHWILSDVNIIRCRKTDIIEFCLMLISSHVEKQTTLNFVWSYNYLSDADANKGCRKTASIEFCLMLTSSDADTSEVCQMFVLCAKKQVLLNFVWCQYHQMQKHIEFCLMLIYQMQNKRYHWILSDVNIIRSAIIEFCLMLIS